MERRQRRRRAMIAGAVVHSEHVFLLCLPPTPTYVHGGKERKALPPPSCPSTRDCLPACLPARQLVPPSASVFLFVYYATTDGRRYNSL